MSDDRPWYREPETFVAVAALVVSISAVVVGMYEAALQRKHDRAEVWPRVELTTYTSVNGASIFVENTGIGPALIKSIAVTVDGKRAHNWPEVLAALLGHEPAAPVSNSTVAEHALRAGDKVMIVGVPNIDMPNPFWKTVGRVGLTICYSSVFEEYWVLRDSAVGNSRTRWEPATGCPTQVAGEDF